MSRREAFSSGRATLEDVAREAGVSVATADRVVNRREGVRAKTISRVEDAILKLGYRADPLAARLARNRTHRFAFILPTGANSFMTQLEREVRRTAERLAVERAFIDVMHVDVFDAGALVAALEDLPPVYDGIAVVALDHSRVRAAIDDLSQRGVPVVTLVSDVPQSRRVHYVGVDNPAAGRTAGSLMGRFLAGRGGVVGLIAGSMALRDHAERHFGFHQVASTEFPGLTLLPPVEGRDDNARNEALTLDLLERHPDLIGIYNIGAGNSGIAKALEAADTARRIVWIAHELTPQSRSFLLSGTLDALINQDAGHEARSAARVLLAQCRGEPILEEQERIRIDVFLRDNLP
ncbi:MAG: LacI family DNA-binding transcriptional regulator [Hyphomicrobiales bacterium]|nr:LacI family DNA-binding transcriptional regulator [Hyphomicrobiales bacterium]